MTLKESIKTHVLVEESGGEEAELAITYEDDVLEFSLDGQTLFSGDWESNFFHVFKRALFLWQEY